jgi:hypothetical protein
LNKSYNSHFPPKLIFNLALFDSLRGFIADDREKLLDTHSDDASSTFNLFVGQLRQSGLGLWCGKGFLGGENEQPIDLLIREPRYDVQRDTRRALSDVPLLITWRLRYQLEMRGELEMSGMVPGQFMPPNRA